MNRVMILLAGALVGALAISLWALNGVSSQRDAARITAAGLASLDSAQKAENARLRQQLENLREQKRRDSIAFEQDRAQLGSQLADALARARATGKTRTDTITITVGALEDTDRALTSCEVARSSCEATAAVEYSLRVSAEKLLAVRTAELSTARSLIPTALQHRLHDAKVAGVTAAVLVTLKVIVGALVR